MMMPKLKPGDKVYRVIDDPEGPRLACVEIKSASDRRIVLRRPFPFSFGVRWSPNAFGRDFFLTPEGALRKFIERHEYDLVTANNRIAELTREIKWARLALQHMEELDG